ncbi:MAG: RNA-processing protein [Methanoregulaceae archaeon]|jgi:nucleolar protein 56|nr:RNA-processing protein [Methanoregulaceae archaeon]
MKSYWFLDQACGTYHPLPHDPVVLAKRAEELSTTGMAEMPEWEVAVRCGFAKDRSEYLDILHRTAMCLAGINLEKELKADQPELIQMVKMLDQIDSVINLVSESAVEWYRILNPAFSRKSVLPQGKKLRDLMREGSDDALLEILDEIDRLARCRSALAKRVTAKASEVLPNCSALSGGLVAARLAAEAGGIHELSMMPGSTIQVLGAGNALFSHLSTGSPPPKHGLVFQYSGVHGSRKERRGRVARVLAAKLAIAARIDYYRGEPDHEFIAKARVAIRNAGRANDLDRR